jgi:hypothetical protein
MYRNIIGIKESPMDLIQRTELVSANIIGDKEEILIRGTRTMRSPKMTISVIDVGILHIFSGIAVHQSI